jgi:hypothetical protein
MSHNKSSKAQKEYVMAIVHQLSLQRLSDTEIVDFLAEKGIVLARTTVNQIKKGIEKQAEKWYINLKHSRYKYIATYKERIDSLVSYQKILNDIIKTTALHSIEMDIFNLWKQLPELDIAEKAKQLEQEKNSKSRSKSENHNHQYLVNGFSLVSVLSKL